MIPDRLPEALREIIARFPPGTLQFEVGIQTFNPEKSVRSSAAGRIMNGWRIIFIFYATKPVFTSTPI